MLRAVGFVIVLYALSHFFSSAMIEANIAATKVFRVIGDSAEVASVKLIETK